jgi:hypothetical protein
VSDILVIRIGWQLIACKKKVIYFLFPRSVKKKRTLSLMFFETKKESTIPSHLKFSNGNAKDMPESKALLDAAKSMI